MNGKVFVGEIKLITRKTQTFLSFFAVLTLIVSMPVAAQNQGKYRIAKSNNYEIEFFVVGQISNNREGGEIRSSILKRSQQHCDRFNKDAFQKKYEYKRIKNGRRTIVVPTFLKYGCSPRVSAVGKTNISVNVLCSVATINGRSWDNEFPKEVADAKNAGLTLNECYKIQFVAGYAEKNYKYPKNRVNKLTQCHGSPITGSFSDVDSWDNCSGTLIFSLQGRVDGRKYVGGWKNGTAHGKGTMTLDTPHKRAGSKYVGEWKNNKIHGKGSQTYEYPHIAAGQKYIGEFKNGKSNGQGIYTFDAPNKIAGLKYVGEVKNNKYHGKGTIVFEVPHRLAGLKYVGGFKNNIRHGQGIMTFDPPHNRAGVKYVGNWMNDKPNGNGTETHDYPSQHAGWKYVGEFRDGKRHGHGTQISDTPNKHAGMEYTGSWKEDKRQGQGTIIYKAPHRLAGQKYVGEWKNNVQNGLGIHTDADGRVEEGVFEKGKFQYVKKVSPTASADKPCPGTYKHTWNNCIGTRTFSDKAKYKGHWKSGKQHGQGTLTYADGEIYVGSFKEGVHHGKGTVTYPNGKTMTGRWENDKFKGN